MNKLYNVGDFIVYKKDVCKVKEIKNNKLNKTDYYILSPIDDESLIIDTPTNNKMGYIRDVMSKKDANDLINKIPEIEPLTNINDKLLERTYKDLLYNGNHEDLIKIIKTAYLRNDTRLKNNKKLSEKDNIYFKQAEKYLYNEISVSLKISFEDTKNYIINRVVEIINN